MALALQSEGPVENSIPARPHLPSLLPETDSLSPPLSESIPGELNRPVPVSTAHPLPVEWKQRQSLAVPAARDYPDEAESSRTGTSARLRVKLRIVAATPHQPELVFTLWNDLPDSTVASRDSPGIRKESVRTATAENGERQEMPLKSPV